MSYGYRQDRREQVIAWLNARPRGEVQTYQMLMGLGIRKSNAQKILSRLTAEGVLERVRPGVYAVRMDRV